MVASSLIQWTGVVINLAGILIFFLPADLPSNQIPGFVIAVIGVIPNAGSSILERYMNHRGTVSPPRVITVSMGIGSMILVAAGILAQSWPKLSPANWLMTGWLAIVNTAVAFSI